jgi:nitrite reductase/ring-hydroxylating ferredoxin subunit
MKVTGRLDYHVNIDINAGRERQRESLPTGHILDDVDTWTEVVGFDELTDGKPVRVAVNDDAVLLLKADNAIFAIGNQCTHQGAGLDRGVVKIAGSVRTVTCPAHGSVFGLDDGKVMRPPATKPVPVYDVKVGDGRVFVRPRTET